ncbi:MAG: hypothetical protein ETSY1_07185, partial [Candidatus Entotheonella factor]
MDDQLADIRFGPDGLVLAVVQDASDGTVLALIEMNREALLLTLQTGMTHAWNPSQQMLYKLGEPVGQEQQIVNLKRSDDGDKLLIQVHRAPDTAGQRPYFAKSLLGAKRAEPPSVTEMPAAL